MNLAEHSEDRARVNSDFPVGSNVAVGQIRTKTTHIELEIIFGDFILAVGVDKFGGDIIVGECPKVSVFLLVCLDGGMETLEPSYLRAR